MEEVADGDVCMGQGGVEGEFLGLEFGEGGVPGGRSEGEIVVQSSDAKTEVSGGGGKIVSLQGRKGKKSGVGKGDGCVKRLSPYFAFAKKNREKVKAALIAAGKKPSASVLGKALGELWHSLAAAEKEAVKKCALTSKDCGEIFGEGEQEADFGPWNASADKVVPPSGSEKSVADLDAQAGPHSVSAESEAGDLQQQLQENGAFSAEGDDVMEGEGLMEQAGKAAVVKEAGPATFPLTRVKRIIKLDSDIRLVSSSGVTAITKATELFLETLASSTFSVMVGNKRKTIRAADICSVVKAERRFRDCIGTSLECLQVSGSNGRQGEDGEGLDEYDINDKCKTSSGVNNKIKVKKSLPPPPGSRRITDCFVKLAA